MRSDLNETDNTKITIRWDGPYSWPGYEQENGLLPIPDQAGLYLQTVEYGDGFLVYLAGITRRSIPRRFSEHTRNYLRGDYNVLDIGAMRSGIRKEIWHGWGWTPEKKEDFKKRNRSIISAVYAQLAGFRIFTCYLGTAPRILERLEAAIMNCLYGAEPPFCDIPDKGMKLSPRKKSEKPIICFQEGSHFFYGLPENIEM